MRLFKQILAGFMSLVPLAAGAASDPPQRVPQNSRLELRGVYLWIYDGQIWMQEDGVNTPLALSNDTPEVQQLMAMLEQEGATKEKPYAMSDRVILVGGGGQGWDRRPTILGDPVPYICPDYQTADNGAQTPLGHADQQHLNPTTMITRTIRGAKR